VGALVKKNAWPTPREGLAKVIGERDAKRKTNGGANQVDVRPGGKRKSGQKKPNSTSGKNAEKKKKHERKLLL